MKTRAKVSPEKIRGGFYTPPDLVDACLERIAALLPGERNLRILEPSAGDGAFLRRLVEPDWRNRIDRVVAIEPLEIEAQKARRALVNARYDKEVLIASAIEWSVDTDEQFDVAVGNPPFVRYQFIATDDQISINDLAWKLGVQFRGVGNLWIPVLLAALSRIRTHGAFAFVIPTECLTGSSAAAVRRWLMDECDEIRFDLFAPGSFPDVLQEVAILSGIRCTADVEATTIRIVDHSSTCREWSHRVTDAGSWTRYLLDPVHLTALSHAQGHHFARPLASLVAFEVSIVTGANDFFSVDDSTLAAYGLEEWAVPLLPRTRHAPGLVFHQDDWNSTRHAGVRSWLLNFRANLPDPNASEGPARYLRLGEAQALPDRYKCRIRDPWFRVPGFVRGELLLSKRSHSWPRVIVNEVGAYTTDTIYRGRLVSTDRTARDIAASFHNTLTLLTVELEGRSFGGGVLELVPSETARLTALVPPGAGRMLPDLDAVARSSGTDALIHASDAYLVSAGALAPDLLPLLCEARELLASRRFERNKHETADSLLAGATA